MHVAWHGTAVTWSVYSLLLADVRYRNITSWGSCAQRLETDALRENRNGPDKLSANWGEGNCGSPRGDTVKRDHVFHPLFFCCEGEWWNVRFNLDKLWGEVLLRAHAHTRGLGAYEGSAKATLRQWTEEGASSQTQMFLTLFVIGVEFHFSNAFIACHLLLMRWSS